MYPMHANIAQSCELQKEEDHWRCQPRLGFSYRPCLKDIKQKVIEQLIHYLQASTRLHSVSIYHIHAQKSLIPFLLDTYFYHKIQPCLLTSFSLHINMFELFNIGYFLLLFIQYCFVKISLDALYIIFSHWVFAVKF